jgi:ATP-binding cassette, subfamily C, bacterial CydCD
MAGPRLIDPRLTARVAATRRYLVVAVIVGIGGAVSVVAQAALLASIISRSFFHHTAVSQMTPLFVGLAAACVFRALCIFVGEAAAHRTSATVTSVLRRQLLHHALDLGPTWLADQRAGELSITATRGIDALNAYFGRYLPQAVLALFVPIGVLAWVAYLDWVSLLILLALVALIPVAMIFFGRASAQHTARQWRRLSSLSARFLELIQGLPTLRAFGRQDQGRREVAAATEGLRVSTMETLRIAFLSALSMELISGLGVGLVAMVLGLRLLSGHLTLSVALGVLLVSPEVFVPLRRAGAEFHASAEGQAAAERILGILDVPMAAPSATDLGPGQHSVAAANGGTTNAAIALPLSLHDLGVRFPDRGEPIFKDFRLEVAAGEHVALTGPSGVGKSTLLGVMMAFVQPEAGCVRVGDLDLATTDPTTWRQQLSWVPQRPHLFNGSVADNLRIGDPKADEAALWRALDAVALSDMCHQLPDGLETRLGEDGLTFSAGERQRLGLARAILRPAPVILLDEPASHLDQETEVQLRASLSEWMAPRTVVVVAHRPELVAQIDRVVAL